MTKPELLDINDFSDSETPCLSSDDTKDMLHPFMSNPHDFATLEKWTIDNPQVLRYCLD